MKTFLLAACCLFSSLLCAEDYSLVGSLQTEHTDNALKSNFAELDEFQHTVGLAFATNPRTSYVDLDVDYHIEHRFFSENSQSDDAKLNGDSSLSLKLFGEAIVAIVDHNREQVLEEEYETDLYQNQKDRDISSGTLIWKLGSNINSLSLYGRHTEVVFEDLENRGSDRVEGGGYWQRALSKVSSFGVQGEYREVEYDDGSFSIYEYSSISLVYSAALSRLKYQLSLGQNEVTQEGEVFSGGLFNLSGSYESTLFNGFFRLSRSLTDTSLGDGDAELLLDDYKGFTSGASDVVERDIVEFKIEREMLCSTCRLELNGVYKKADYKNIKADRAERRGSVLLHYSISRVSSLSFSYSRFDWEYGVFFEEPEHQLSELRGEYHHKLGRSLFLKLFMADIKRDGGSDRGYSSLSAGLKLDYHFK